GAGAVGEYGDVGDLVVGDVRGGVDAVGGGRTRRRGHREPGVAREGEFDGRVAERSAGRVLVGVLDSAAQERRRGALAVGVRPRLTDQGPLEFAWPCREGTLKLFLYGPCLPFDVQAGEHEGHLVAEA